MVLHKLHQESRQSLLKMQRCGHSEHLWRAFSASIHPCFLLALFSFGGYTYKTPHLHSESGCAQPQGWSTVTFTWASQHNPSGPNIMIGLGWTCDPRLSLRASWDSVQKLVGVSAKQIWCSEALLPQTHHLIGRPRRANGTSDHISWALLDCVGGLLPLCFSLIWVLKVFFFFLLKPCFGWTVVSLAIEEILTDTGPRTHWTCFTFFGFHFAWA